LVFVEGRLTKRKWQDKEGNDRYSTEVVALNLKPLDKKEGGSGINMPTSEDEFPSVKLPDNTKSESTSNSSSSSDDDDLPF
jgi:single-strand DNA-binding protein